MQIQSTVITAAYKRIERNKKHFYNEEEMFGKMRDATQEEQECISKYINNIAEDTGVNFYDLC